MDAPTQSEATSEQPAAQGGLSEPSLDEVREILRVSCTSKQDCLDKLDDIIEVIEQRVLSKQDSGEAVCVVHILDGEHVSINCTQALFNLPDGKHLLYTNPQPRAANK